MNILVVDDDADCLESYGDALKVLGHLPTLCESVVIAMKEFQSGSFPLVLSDIRMPDKSGIDLLRDFQAIPSTKRPEVVLLTGFAELDSAIEAIRLGAFDYLRKPVAIQDLARVIARWEQTHPSFTENSSDDPIYNSFLEAMTSTQLFTDPKLTLNGLARILGTNRNILSKVINRKLGDNFNQILNRFRIKEYQRLHSLSVNEKFTIEALAKMAGFSSRSSFNRFFQQEFGCRPSKWQGATTPK
jgi:YesN/AraC family two-component response regulator